MAKTAENTSFSELKTAIRTGNPGRLYFFHGEEVYLLRYYLDALRKKLLDPLTESFNFHRFNGETFSMQAFSDAVENMPMMSDHTFVQLDEIDPFKLPEDERKKATELLADIPEYCTVVFCYELSPWQPDKRFKALWSSIESAGKIVEFPKQSPRELSAWITRHFAKLGKSISQELCLYLVDLTGGTMTALSGEIQKIAAFSGADTITKYDIDSVTEPVLDAVVFQMTDLLGAGDYSAALDKLQVLLKMQQEPIAILGAIGSHFRRISAGRTLLDSGKGASDLARLYGIKDYPARKSMDAARKFSSRFCKKASEWILQTDMQLKTSYDDPQRLLELLILRLAQEAKNGSH